MAVGPLHAGGREAGGQTALRARHSGSAPTEEAIAEVAPRAAEPIEVRAARASSRPPSARDAGHLRATDREGVTGTPWYVGLWSVLLVMSAAVALVPGIPVAVPNPLLAVGLATLAGAVGLALLQLGLVRFFISGGPLDLFVGLAFGTLALANLGIRVLGPVMGTEAVHGETNLALILLTRALAAGLFLAGLARSDRVIEADQRRGFTLRLVGILTMALAAGTAVILAAGSHMPSAVDLLVLQWLEGHATVVDFLPGQEPWVLLTNGAIALLLLLATVGYMQESGRRGDRHVTSVALALTLLSFSQVHSLLFPPITLEYVSSADVFRLGAYVVLLFSLVQRIGGEIAERASREERLRLSRELHDGLAQHLALLNLRLTRARARERPAARRAQDLEAAQRLVESAWLEARQAITALRTGSVSWEEFTRGVTTFAAEFGQNHDVEVRVATEGAVPALGTELQVEVLRILQEAFSNAIRHGAATRLDVALAARREGLEVRVRDNGRGLSPERRANDAGVGLRSLSERAARRGGALSLESVPGQGVTVRAWLPLSRTRVETA
jgi:signal transduction histidine kinase